MNRQKGLVTRLEVLEAIGDSISANIFKMIANNPETTDSLIDKLHVSRKQYYVRIAKLYAAGLIIRRGREYTLTSFGRLIYWAHTDLAKASENLLKLKAIDLIMAHENISPDDYRKLVDSVIEDTELKNTIINFT
jgi:predicted transcriptional regulator